MKNTKSTDRAISVVINGHGLSLDQVWQVGTRPEVKVTLCSEARAKMQASRDYILDQIRTQKKAIYGVNTGFGAFSEVRISDEKIRELQKNLIRSHACGVGEPLSPETVRAILLLRAQALSRGHSGVRPELVDRILLFLNEGLIPWIPCQGSVGASGDLAPLAHLALALMGEGYLLKVTPSGRERVPTSKVLERLQIPNFDLIEKEGLALINGCQAMTALGLLNLKRAKSLLTLADLAGAMSLEALRGSRSAFDPLISAARPHPGEIQTAKNLRLILDESSEIGQSHKDCEKVQDPYSLRCMPAVHGAAKDQIQRAIETLLVEANSSTDNPLVFADEGKILSCGNFHGEPVAFQLDFSAIALSAMAAMSECRIAKLINPTFSGLPAFLAKNGGLESGHMIVQVAAASLVSENKGLSHPASVDSIPTSVDKEDHVSMGMIASRKLERVVANCEQIFALELLSASQAIDFLRPLKASQMIESAQAQIRKVVPFAETDRFFGDDIEALANLIQQGVFDDLCKEGGVEC